MKFKSFFYLSALFVGACCLTSCEDSSGEDAGELASIYWNKSAAFKMQLKGNVHSLITEDGTNYTFNQSGNVTSLESQNDVTEYEYSNSRLIREIYTQTWEGVQTRKDTTTYTYGTSGKYVPLFEQVESGLCRNIARLKTRFRTADFVQRGDSMLVISSNNDYYRVAGRAHMVQLDTASLTFNGNFPVTFRSRNAVYNMTYASDGRFLTIEEVYENTYDGRTSYLTTFKANSDNLLATSRERTQNDDTEIMFSYTYNENEDVTFYATQDFEVEYSDYQYDAKGNWISRKYRSRYTYVDVPTWSEKTTQTRTITYWE